jgi:hypothetical protein
VLLLLYGFLSASTDQSVNRWCGGIFSVFGLVMLLLSTRNNAKDSEAE